MSIEWLFTKKTYRQSIIKYSHYIRVLHAERVAELFAEDGVEKAGLELQLGYLDLLAMATNRSRSRRKIAPTSQRQAEFLVEGPVDLKLCDTYLAQHDQGDDALPCNIRAKMQLVAGLFDRY